MTAAQNELALSYHSMRELHFLADISTSTIVTAFTVAHESGN